MGLPRRRSKSLLNGATSGLDDGCMSTIAARVGLVHERCTRLSSGAQVDGCTRLLSGAQVDGCTRLHSGAVVVHK